MAKKIFYNPNANSRLQQESASGLIESIKSDGLNTSITVIDDQTCHRIERPKIDAVLKPSALRALARERKRDRQADEGYRLSMEKDLIHGWYMPEERCSPKSS